MGRKSSTRKKKAVKRQPRAAKQPPDTGQPEAQEQPEYREVSQEELKQILEAHRTWVESEGQAGTQADLSNVNLQETYLQRANLAGANLQGAMLAGADLRAANLEKANLSRANLQRASLSLANLQEADLAHADLRWASLTSANLRGARLLGADTHGRKGRGASNPVFSWIKTNPAIFGTVLYLYVSMIGSTYQWMLFGQFGVNVFDFAETNDFLTAAFKQPIVILQGIAGAYLLAWASPRVPAVWRLVGSSRGTQSEFSIRRSFLQPIVGALWLAQVLNLGLAVLGIIAYTFAPGILFAHEEAKRIREGWGTYIHVEFTRRVETFKTVPGTSLMLLGTTDKFVIFYEPAAERPHIVPTATIARMRTCDATKPFFPWWWTELEPEPCTP